ncbi:unnamed protein product, partial [Mesorhabditis spiculigera]
MLEPQFLKGSDGEAAGELSHQNPDELMRCPWYWGDVGWAGSERLLEPCPVGTFLIRDSHNDFSLYTLSWRDTEKVLHSRITSSFPRGTSSAIAWHLQSDLEGYAATLAIRLAALLEVSLPIKNPPRLHE